MTEAEKNLRENQKQLDADGVMVGVSRQAVHEVLAETARLRAAIEAIKRATLDGKVCADVAWFSDIETLHDFCASTLAQQPS